MDELKDLADETEFVATRGSGSLLATARKQQQKTIEEIAGELNLSVTQIKTIELDQTDGLPEPTYVRGYIRAYAKLLGLDPEEVLKNYLNPNWQQSSSLNDIPRGISNADDSSDRFFTLSKVISIFLLTAIGAFMWYTGMIADLIGTEPAVNESQLVLESGEPSGQDFASRSSTAQLAEAPATEPSETGSSGAEPSKTDQGTAQNEMVLSFSETSWVDIRDDQDNRLAYKSYVEGEDLRVSSNGFMSVFIGNAAGVTVQYNSEPFDIAQYREGVYAKFVVGE